MNVFKRIYERKTIRIGIFGLVGACGTTHISVSIANYYASKEKMSVLYLECERGKRISEQEEEKNGVIALRTKQSVSVGGHCGFIRSGVCYLPSLLPEDIRRLLVQPGDVIIAEIPQWQGNLCLRPGMFDLCIFPFSAKPWKYAALQKNLRQMISVNDDIPQGKFCSFGLTKAEEKKIAAEFHLRCEALPLMRDPFRLEKEDVRFLKEFLA